MLNTELLSKIDSPADIKALDKEQLVQLCDELRHFIIDELSHNSGHLGASLGVVELTVALHYVFDAPHDRLVWDVGHQAYAHKILTGRRTRFSTNRCFGGLSGFPNPKESEYDAFGTGHSSTSISAALGMSVASKLQAEERKVVAVIGDGSMTGGLAFEGLNNASINPNNLLIILNDNGIAIDPIKSGINRYLNSIHTSITYNKVRYQLYRLLKAVHLIDEQTRKRLIRVSNSLKSGRYPKNNIFEGLNIRYFGPIDGHDVVSMVETLEKIKDFEGPKVLHCITVKGKGYKSAEESATLWHAPGEFNKETGEIISKPTANKPPLFQDVFGETLVELAQKNDRIVGVSPAMLTGCSMTKMQRVYPQRVFDVGIAEGHAVTFSAGLAKEGMLPFCNIYSSFMQRAYDNVIHDVALQELNVVMCLDRAGLVGKDGATHQGAFDLAYFRCIPNLTIASPYNEAELRNLMYTAQLANKGPFVIRYPRGAGVMVDWRTPMQEVPVGTGRCLKEGTEVAVLTLGPIGNVAQRAIEQLGSDAARVAHYDMRFLKPLDEQMLHTIGKKFAKIVTVEDGVVAGGMGSAVLEFMAEHGYTPALKRVGIPDRFVEHGTPDELYAMLGMDAEGIKKVVLASLK